MSEGTECVEGLPASVLVTRGWMTPGPSYGVEQHPWALRRVPGTPPPQS